MQASRLLKTNIDALLRERHQTRHDLAMWCRKSDAWLSKILSDSPSDQARGMPMKYLDRIADFFGLATYQLFQPGLGGIGERRKAERRSGKDRRVSALNQRVHQTLSDAIASLTQTDVADMIRLKTLTEESRSAARAALKELEDAEKRAARQGRKRPSTGGASNVARFEKGRGEKPSDGSAKKPPIDA